MEIEQTRKPESEPRQPTALAAIGKVAEGALEVTAALANPTGTHAPLRVTGGPSPDNEWVGRYTALPGDTDVPAAGVARAHHAAQARCDETECVPR